MLRISVGLSLLVVGIALVLGGGCRNEGDIFIMSPSNLRPEVDDIPDQVATRGVPFVLDLSSYVTDDHDDVTSLSFFVFAGQGTFTGSIYDNTFDSTGLQIVDFIVLDTEGAGTTGLLNINVLSPPVADFTADSTYGPATLTVNFTDVSTGDIDTWSWDFGDSNTSTEQNPSHDYTSPGWYDVSLTVSGLGGSDTIIKHSFIQVLGPASNTWYVDSSNTGTTVHDGYAWDTAFLTILSGIEAATDGDVVLVADGSYTGTSNTDLDFGGKPLYLKAYDYYGTGLCTIDCEDSARAFYFHNGETSEAVVEGFTIVGGYSPTTGAGIYMDGASPVIRNCSITNCLSDMYGGAIGFESASPVITGCVLSGNRAALGGAIYSGATTATAIVSHCTLSGNRGIGGGGGIHCADLVTLTIDHSEITDNSGAVGAGIFAMTGNTLIITDCNISGNSSDSTGGGIFIVDNSTLDISDSSFMNNYATIGGGIFTSMVNATLLNCSLTENDSLSMGSAVCLTGDSATPHGCSATITGCTFADNSSINGALASNCVDTTVDNCVFLNNDGFTGSAYMFSGNDTDPTFFNTIVTATTMTGNSGFMGGAVLGSHMSATFQNCTISNNSASQSGGGLQIGGGSGFTMLTLKDCTLSNNSSGLFGAALYTDYGCDPLVITGCTFTGNTAVFSGGAVYAGSNDPAMVSNITMSDCEVLNNSGSYQGGGINFVNYFDAQVTATTIRGNSASQSGGGVAVNNSNSGYTSSFTISNCLIESNSCMGQGGGIAASGPYLNFAQAVDCVIIGNSAGLAGGGVLLNTGTSGSTTLSEFSNCLIAGNDGPDAGGGVFISGYNSATFINCTVADNEAIYAGGGFYCDSATCITTLTNCIIWSNTAATTGSQIFYGTSEFYLLSSDYANATADITGTGVFTPDGGCITVDPLFVTGPRGAYYISQITAGQVVDSPCLDAGAGTLAGLGLTGKTTRNDEVADTDPPDMGYHYDP